MRSVVRHLVAVTVLLGARPGFAACGDRPGDADAVAAARAAAEAACPCAAATGHGEYVRCTARAVNAAVTAGRLRPRCRAAVMRCAARSTCGRPGFVACCRIGATGETSCGVRGSAASCTAPGGGSACVSDASSCCDACGPGGCSPTTSTTLPRPGCGTDAECDDGNGCSLDRCIDGLCTHECLCVGPAGSLTCCPGPAAECGTPAPAWFHTCGDPVCGGHRDHPGVPACTAQEKAGASCLPEGATCDPGDECNALLECARTDPTRGGLCPISRRRDKQDVDYLDAAGLKRLHDELMKFPLATYRYRAAPSRTHLGFVMEDVEPSASVDPARDMVDLYGYTSMAVAALQTQAREIETLRREVKALRHALRARRKEAGSVK
jgi:hypothetical protein